MDNDAQTHLEMLLQKLSQICRGTKVPWSPAQSFINEEEFFVCLTRIKSAGGTALFHGPNSAGVRAIDELEHLVESSKGIFVRRLVNVEKCEQLIAALAAALTEAQHLINTAPTPAAATDLIQDAQQEAKRIIEEAKEEARRIIEEAKGEKDDWWKLDPTK